MATNAHERSKLATRLSFLAGGFAFACWAPLVPYAKHRVGADDRLLGFILLGLGIGSLLAMPLTGWMSSRLGTKPMIVVGGLGIACLLPGLAYASHPVTLALALLGFGGSLGILDVAMNTHAVEVERAGKVPLISGFHAMFSVGGFAGAGCMTWLLSMGLTPLAAATIGALITAAAILLAWPRLLPARGGHPAFAMPHGFVMLLAALAAVAFLVEGALLDWSALLLIDSKIVDAAQGGLGYMLFAIAMTTCRLTGDQIVVKVGNFRTVFWGGMIATGGFAVVLLAPSKPLSLAGFLLVGLGSSNIVPVLFRLVGNQTKMPPALAVAALTTTAYFGVLAGPAAMGFVAHAVGLRSAFWLLAGLMALFPVCARRVARGG